MSLRKTGTGDGSILLPDPATEDQDGQGISTTAVHRVEQQPWTDADAEDLADENRR